MNEPYENCLQTAEILQFFLLQKGLPAKRIAMAKEKMYKEFYDIIHGIIFRVLSKEVVERIIDSEARYHMNGVVKNG